MSTDFARQPDDREFFIINETAETWKDLGLDFPVVCQQELEDLAVYETDTDGLVEVCERPAVGCFATGYDRPLIVLNTDVPAYRDSKTGTLIHETLHLLEGCSGMGDSDHKNTEVWDTGPDFRQSVSFIASRRVLSVYPPGSEVSSGVL